MFSLKSEDLPNLPLLLLWPIVLLFGILAAMTDKPGVRKEIAVQVVCFALLATMFYVLMTGMLGVASWLAVIVSYFGGSFFGSVASGLVLKKLKE